MATLSLKHLITNFYIRALTWRRGGFVGADSLGNRYYRSSAGGQWGREQRWVIYGAEDEASLVPPEWHGWLHHRIAQPPTERPPVQRPWQKPHLPNRTGTEDAYRPPGHTLEGGRRARVTGDYQPWTPPPEFALHHSPSHAAHHPPFSETPMQRNAIEPILGALVLVAAAAFTFFAYGKTGHRSFAGYPLTARFSAIDGLQMGSDVRIGGVKVGEVTDISLDPATYLAMVKLTVDPSVKLPTDSVASVATEGLLGGKYLGLLPGSSDDMLKPGARISRTEASVSLKALMGQFIYSLQNTGGSKSNSGGQSGAPAPGTPAQSAPVQGAPAAAAPTHP